MWFPRFHEGFLKSWSTEYSEKLIIFQEPCRVIRFIPFKNFFLSKYLEGNSAIVFQKSTLMLHNAFQTSTPQDHRHNKLVVPWLPSFCINTFWLYKELDSILFEIYVINPSYPNIFGHPRFTFCLKANFFFLRKLCSVLPIICCRHWGKPNRLQDQVVG